MSPAEDQEPQWLPLNSSHVEAMQWWPDRNELRVRFKGGQVYSYNADPAEAEGLRTAASPGRFVKFFLRNGNRIE